MKRLMYAAACVAVLAACTKEQAPVQKDEQLNGSESVIVTAKDFVLDGTTKTVITQSGSDAPAFAWKDGDVIGIIPMNGKTVQSNYEIAEIGSNPKNATFDGGVWALKEGKEYAAYYPFNERIARSGDNLEFSFLGQTQSANNSLEHLGAYDYMYASAVVPQSGSAQFDFEHKISLVRLQLTVPKADTYTRVVLESSGSWFAGSASLKLSDGTMTAAETVKSAIINLSDIEVAANGVLTVWFAMLPTNALNGKNLRIKTSGQDEVYTGEITGITTIVAGSAYSYAATLTSQGQEVEYVDLGLSVKWATCNLGAKSPEESGDYYAWGETETKDNYSPETYKYLKEEKVIEDDISVNYSGYIKYVPQNKAESKGFRGFYDNKTTLDPEDDVAHVKIGGKWRIPTYSEISELTNTDYCKWERVSYKGVSGYRITSKVSGFTEKWIFLPVAGYMYLTNKLNADECFYWSSTVYEREGYDVRFLSKPVSLSMSRWSGLPIRPVSK